MNERIRELALEAGFYANPDVEKFEKFAELIVAAEREKIAQMFDGKVWAYDYREIAAAIRARRDQ